MFLIFLYILCLQQLAVSRESVYVGHIKQSVMSYLLSQSDAGIDNRADLMADEVVVNKNTKKISKKASGISCIE